MTNIIKLPEVSRRPRPSNPSAVHAMSTTAIIRGLDDQLATVVGIMMEMDPSGTESALLREIQRVQIARRDAKRGF